MDIYRLYPALTHWQLGLSQSGWEAACGKRNQSADTREQNLILTEKESFIEAGKINTKGKDEN